MIGSIFLPGILTIKKFYISCTSNHVTKSLRFI